MPVCGNSISTPSRAIFGYELVSLLGQGAGSIIYAVCRPGSNQLLAMKHVVCKAERDHRYYEQLHNEYEVGRQVCHSALRRSLELKLETSWMYKVREAALVMELVDGIPLDQQHGVTIADTMATFGCVAGALRALHALGYVHCDLKPNNILRSADGRTRVIDLGQACVVNSVKKRIQGTVDYIAPEQVKLQPITPRTDVFNYGATLYWALTRKHLPTFLNIAKNPNSFLLDSAMAPPHLINDQVPEALSLLVMDCVHTDPNRRPDLVDVQRRLDAIAFASARHTAQPKTGPNRCGESAYGISTAGADRRCQLACFE